MLKKTQEKKSAKNSESRKQRSQTTLTSLRKKCLELAKTLAKKSDNYTCVTCGRKTNIHGSHVFPEGKYRSMSADVDNIMAQCYYCHLSWWHKHPTEAGQWFIEKYPIRYNNLKKRSLTPQKIDWQKKYEELSNTRGTFTEHSDDYC